MTDPLQRLDRVIKVIVALITLAAVVLIGLRVMAARFLLVVMALGVCSRVSRAQMSPYDDELSRQLRGVSSPMLSPDGRLVAYVRTTSRAVGTASTDDVVIVNVADRKELATFAGASPRWMANGAELAFVAMRDGKRGLWSRNLATGLFRLESTSVPIAATMTHEQRSADGRSIYFVASDHGSMLLYRSHAGGDDPKPVLRCACSVSDVSIDSGGHLAAFVRSAITDPPDVYTVRLDTADVPKPLTRVNARVVLEALMTDADTFSVTGTRGTAIQVWVIPPAGAQPGQKYPTLLSLDRGPRAVSSAAFSDRFQLLATRGYGVVFPGVGFSNTDTPDRQKHAAQVVDDVDALTAFAAAMARYPWIDATRVGVTAIGRHVSVSTGSGVGALRVKPAVSMAAIAWRNDLRLDQALTAAFTTR